MKVLFWYCDQFAWTPSMKTLEEVPDQDPQSREKVVVAFIHVEPSDVENGSSAETKLVKNCKWLARKWDVTTILLHSFSHLSEEKADPQKAIELFDRAQDRLVKAGYDASQTAYGYFNDLSIEAPGHPLARIFKSF